VLERILHGTPEEQREFNMYLSKAKLQARVDYQQQQSAR